MLNVLIYVIIIVFSFSLREFLSPVSFLLVLLASVRLFSQRLLNQVAINVICLGLFIYYFVTYGRVITPEIGLNFLLNIILLKFMESKKYRDDVMCIFGMILLVASGSLFEKTLSYFVFFGVSFFLLISALFKLNGIRLITLKNGRNYLFLSIFIALLFFIFPRIPNPIPFTLNAGGQGEIGYSPEINVSAIEKLMENDSKVFWAKLSKAIPREELYWRGNVVSHTNGWDWSLAQMDQGILEISKEDFKQGEEYRLFIKTPYLFVYDMPSMVKVNHKVYQGDSTNSFNSSYLRNTSRYFVHMPSRPVERVKPSPHHLEHALNEESVLWIQKTFKENDLDEIIARYRELITKEKFQYSWSPGKIGSFDEFMSKKIGFCTHYASSLALILRVKNHPTRLVSGFQGGRYNPFGEFYEISQNDAHAWVEVNKDGSWIRVDPTSFIAPERISLDYQEVVSNNFVIPDSEIQGGTSFLSSFSFILSQWDFEFYQLMDQWDSSVQSSYFSQFKLTRARLYILSLILFCSVFFLLLRTRKKKSWRERAWRDFLRITASKGVDYQGSFEKLKIDLQRCEWDKKDLAIVLTEDFMKLFYADEFDKELLQERLKALNR